MRRSPWTVLVVCSLLPVALSGIGRAQTNFQPIYLFGGSGSFDGEAPNGGLIADQDGNLYGTTRLGGTGASGTVYELTPAANGYTETILHNFDGTDGADPFANVVMDANGNLYGTTEAYGLYRQGNVFELSPASDGSWNFHVLHSFTGGADGGESETGLIIDSRGNLYGTTGTGGILNGPCGYGCGVVFELSPTAEGSWHETVLYSFTGGNDGSGPYGSLIRDGAGNLYGTTVEGGNYRTCGGPGCGVVFELSPSRSGNWSESVLYAFKGGRDGFYPNSQLAPDASGNLYGTAAGGNRQSDCPNDCGVIFEVSRETGRWLESVIHAFTGKEDGSGANGGVTFDAEGDLYAASGEGGDRGGGVALKLSKGAAGGWTGMVLHSFQATGYYGSYPSGGFFLDTLGNVYGTAAGPADYSNGGIVYELSK